MSLVVPTSFLEQTFGIHIQSYKVIQDIEYPVFKLITTDNQWYKLKVLPISNVPSFNEVSNWLNFLQAAIPQKTPTYMPNEDGAVCIPSPAGAPYFYILIPWDTWEVLPRFTRDTVYQVGQLLAELHQATKSYPGTAQHVKHIDAHWVNQMAGPILKRAIEHYFPASLSQASNKLEALAHFLSHYGNSSEIVGLIHADLHRKNIVTDGHSLRFIDFDDALFAPYLLDLAVFINELADYPELFDDLKGSFLRGYQSVYPTTFSKSEFVYFKELADLLYIEWVFHPDHHKVRDTPRKLEYGKEALSSFVP